MLYIEDADNQQIGNEIQRLCVLGDIQPPDAPKELVEFFRATFRAAPLETMGRAFDTFLAGKCIDTRKPPKINAHFLSTLMKMYLSANKIDYKKPLMLAERIQTQEDMDRNRKESYEITYDNFLLAKSGKGTLIIKLMEIYGKWKQDYEISSGDRHDAMAWLSKFRRTRDTHIKSELKGFKTIEALSETNNIDVESFAKCYTHFVRRENGTDTNWC